MIFQANPTPAETCRDQVRYPSNFLEGLFQMNSNDLSDIWEQLEESLSSKVFPGFLLKAKPCWSKVWNALGSSAGQIAVEGR